MFGFVFLINGLKSDCLWQGHDKTGTRKYYIWYVGVCPIQKYSVRENKVWYNFFTWAAMATKSM